VLAHAGDIDVTMCTFGAEATRIMRARVGS
jgi:hypothetical protein